MGAVLLGGQHVLAAPLGERGVVRWLALLALVAAGAASYFAALPLFGAYSARQAWRLVARRRLRPSVGSAITPDP